MKNKAFTLIELLVVIAIIGILATVVIASLNSARAKARDAKRMSDLKQVQTALEMYYADNGAYPIGGSYRGVCSVYGSHTTSGPTGYIPNLAPTYIPVLPVDPKPQTNNENCYLYRSNGVDYAFFAHYTYEGISPTQFRRPSNPSISSILFISTPGAVSW